MFQKALKIWFWRCFDPLGRLIVLNFCWFTLLAAAYLFLRIALIFSKPAFFLALTALAGFFLPLLLVAVYKLTQVINEEGVQQSLPFKMFIKKRIFLGLPLYWLSVGAYLLIGSNLYFYVGIYAKHPWVGSVLVAIFFWLFLAWTALQVYIIPLLLDGERNMLTILKHAAVLTIDNPVYTLLNLLMSLLIIIISVSTVLGFILLMVSFLAIWQNTACQIILEKYRQQKQLTEQRGWRQLIKPWEI